jgi:hypothetical protein
MNSTFYWTITRPITFVSEYNSLINYVIDVSKQGNIVSVVFPAYTASCMVGGGNVATATYSALPVAFRVANTNELESDIEGGVSSDATIPFTEAVPCNDNSVPTTCFVSFEPGTVSTPGNTIQWKLATGGNFACAGPGTTIAFSEVTLWYPIN